MTVEVSIAGHQGSIDSRRSVPVAGRMCRAIGPDALLKRRPGGILRGGHLRQFHRLRHKPGFSATQVMQFSPAAFTGSNMLLKRRQQCRFGSWVQRQGQPSPRLAVRQRALPGR